MIIYLVRHGETDLNKKGLVQGQIDMVLNETGLSQARDVGSKFNKLNVEVDEIISSPLKRATKTAEIIKAIIHFPKEIIFNKNFMERDFRGFDYKGVKETMEFLRENPNEEILVEGLIPLRKRVFEGLNEVTTNYSNKTIMLVCHSHVMKTILRDAHIGNKDFSKFEIIQGMIYKIKVKEELVELVEII